MGQPDMYVEVVAFHDVQYNAEPAPSSPPRELSAGSYHPKIPTPFPQCYNVPHMHDSCMAICRSSEGDLSVTSAELRPGPLASG